MKNVCRRFWQSPLPGLLPVIACFLTAVWHMRYDWTYDASYTYGWLVAPLALYLFSVRWRDRPAPAVGPPARTLPWWIVLACLLPLGWLVREANPEWRLLSILLSGIAVSAALLYLADIGGWVWMRHFAGPVIFFMASVPWPSLLERAATGVLMPGNAAVTLEALQWMNIPAVRRGNLISMAGGTLGVEEACSGIRSLQAVIMTAWFAGELQGLRWKPRLALLAASVLTALVTNIIRTIFLSVTAARSGLGAVESWHDSVGFAALVVNIVVILAAAAWMGRKKPAVGKDAPPPSPGTGSRRPLPRRGPAVLAAGLVVMFPLTEWWYRSHEVNPLPPWHLAKPQAEPDFRELRVNDRTVSMLRYSGGWSAHWQTAAGQPVHGFYFHWNPGRVPPENMNVHQPGGCLANLGIEYVAELEPLSLPIAGQTRSLRLIQFKDGSRPVHLLYFVSEDTEYGSGLAEPFDFGYRGRFAAAIKGRRNPGQRFIEIGLWDETSEKNVRAFFSRLLAAWIREGEG